MTVDEKTIESISTEELITRLIACRETAIGDSCCVEGDRCVKPSEFEAMDRERDELQAVTDEVIRRLRAVAPHADPK